MEPCIESGHQMAVPSEMPVMVLPDCHLFPGCLLPLFIFEDRYRMMMRQILDSHRMFCIGNREGNSSDDPISPYSTAGLVRACVRQEEGTSNLLLLGVVRIRLCGWTQVAPYRIAKVEPVPTDPGDPDRVQELRVKAMTLFVDRGITENGKHLRETLKDKDSELVCDVLSYYYTRCPKLQQRLLGEHRLQRRFEMIIEALEKKKCG